MSGSLACEADIRLCASAAPGSRTVRRIADPAASMRVQARDATVHVPRPSGFDTTSVPLPRAEGSSPSPHRAASASSVPAPRAVGAPPTPTGGPAPPAPPHLRLSTRPHAADDVQHHGHGHDPDQGAQQNARIISSEQKIARGDAQQNEERHLHVIPQRAFHHRRHACPIPSHDGREPTRASARTSTPYVPPRGAMDVRARIEVRRWDASPVVEAERSASYINRCP